MGYCIQDEDMNVWWLQNPDEDANRVRVREHVMFAKVLLLIRFLSKGCNVRQRLSPRN